MHACSSGCVSGTMARAFDPKSLKRDEMGTGVWLACASAPKRSVPNLICGAKSERAQRWSYAFQARRLSGSPGRDGPNLR
jgi:hypothetical protein